MRLVMRGPRNEIIHHARMRLHPPTYDHNRLFRVIIILLLLIVTFSHIFFGLVLFGFKLIICI